MGTLYYGDNLDILRRYIKDETIDLVYLDPPFNSAQNYNAFFQEKDGTAAASQIRAFEDTWSWNQESQRAYEELVLQPGKVSEVMQAFRTFLGTNDMMAYLAMMAPRLVELRRALKSTGSLYLHCDPTASHYLKILCDAILGKDNFRNEISWKRSQPKSHTIINFPNCRDVILRYSKTEKAKFNKVYGEYDPEYLEKFYRFTDENGRRYRLGDITNPNRNRPNLTYEFLGITRVWRWTKERMQKAYQDGKIYQSKPGTVPQEKRYLDEKEGQPLSDNWDDIEHLHGSNQEKLPYPTQKPLVLLERIIQASSNPGDLVLDPFCGCGTTIDAAEKLGRNWIGIDVTQLAISLIKNRLQDTYGSRLKFVIGSESGTARVSRAVSGVSPDTSESQNVSLVHIIGEPTTPNEAATLAEEDKYQFQWWALGLVAARPVEQKKGADHGIDGKILFRDDPNAAKPEQIILQVKGGKTGVKDVRDLRGVLDREKAAIGVLISLQPPTREMQAEAASAGFYEHKVNKQKYPRIQLRTVRELMEGKNIERPSNVAALLETFKKAPESKKKDAEQKELI